jgi:hypothetical protein
MPPSSGWIPKATLDRSKLCRSSRDNEVAGQRYLQTAAEAGPVDPSDDRDRQVLETAQRLDRINLSLALVGDSLIPETDIGAGAKVSEPALQQNCSAANLHSRREGVEQRAIEVRPAQIVGSVDHRRDGHVLRVFDGDHLAHRGGTQFNSDWIEGLRKHPALRSTVTAAIGMFLLPAVLTHV